MGLNQRAAHLLSEFSVHLPQWRRLDPIGRIERARTDQDLLSVFAAIGDRHTHCALPTRIRAWLPFVAGACSEGIYVTGSVIEELRAGERIIRWNGMPIAAVLRALMTQQLGANREARAAKAVQTLPFRPLSLMPPPSEPVVTIELEGGRRVELLWRFDGPEVLGQELARLFTTSDTILNETIAVRDRTIRVHSFAQAPEPFLRTFLTALELVPQDGVIIDLRGCEEGIIQTAEQLLQLFSTTRIEPERFRFRMTSAIRGIASRLPPEWRAAVGHARGVYSPPLPITRPEEANGIGRRYPGPVVVLVDALTYSSAEMFAAGIQDHGIGTVVGTAPRTGGGGASAWSQKAIAELTGDQNLAPRPDEPALRIAVRKAQRVLVNEGRAIERKGVVPDVHHALKRGDLTDESQELRRVGERILAEKRKRR